ncbi:hypothetical protein KC717_05660 [Candidatus Dojkabacteria bacterium]|uniref:M56 family metallopeptidase n=1 Tax=Candidatus Dojkabacteria bacterium TaxID=2099670 RepID=A0A955L9G7_9BACT|nr:hypothetical protein [Candidatus Dojkabacteria bacterium]
MQTRNNYHSKKNISFLLIIILGVTYSTGIIISLFNTIPGFLSQLGLVIHYRNDLQGLFELCTSQNFILNSGVALVSLLLFVKIIWGIGRTVANLFVTKKYIQGLSKKRKQKYFELEDSSIHAFSFGNLVPDIFISSNVKKQLTSREFSVLLNHEMYHKSSLDPFKKFITEIIRNILPPFPGRNNLFKNYDVLTEIAADEYTIENGATKKDIFSTTLKVLKLGTTPNLSLASNFGFHNNRFEILNKDRPFTTIQYFFVLFLVIITSNLVGYRLVSAEAVIQCESISDNCMTESNTIETFNPVTDIHTDQHICEIVNQSSYLNFSKKT